MRDFPKSFIFFFWPEIGNLLVDPLNYSHDHGELSKSQKEAVKTLIQKKDRDRRLIKNWRPIFLVNVDVKIGSKAIAKRLEKGLPYIIRGGSRISKGGVDGRPYLLRGGRENALTKKIGNNFTCTCLRRVF